MSVLELGLTMPFSKSRNKLTEKADNGLAKRCEETSVNQRFSAFSATAFGFESYRQNPGFR